jgi:hypothetical protein
MVAPTRPPILPSIVFAGLMRGASFKRPKFWPVTWLKPSNAPVTTKANATADAAASETNVSSTAERTKYTDRTMTLRLMLTR